MAEAKLDPDYVADAIEILAATLPAGESQWRMARAAFDALQPRDAAEAILATEIVAFHYAALDSLRRAMVPDTDFSQVTRLRQTAASMARMRQNAERALVARQAPPVPAREETSAEEAFTKQARAKPAAAPARPVPILLPARVPRPELLDADGQQIPLDRWDLMTMEQRRLAYGYRVEPDTAETAPGAAPAAMPDAASAAAD